MSEINDDELLARAQEIQADKGGSLTDAMILAESELSPKPSVPASFTVTVEIKPRVARWIMEEFAATATHTTEQRLGAYLSTHLSRARVTAMRYAEEAPEIGEGGAVTMRRAQFQKAVKE